PRPDLDHSADERSCSGCPSSPTRHQIAHRVLRQSSSRSARSSHPEPTVPSPVPVLASWKSPPSLGELVYSPVNTCCLLIYRAAHWRTMPGARRLSNILLLNCPDRLVRLVRTEAAQPQRIAHHGHRGERHGRRSEDRGTLTQEGDGGRGDGDGNQHRIVGEGPEQVLLDDSHGGARKLKRCGDAAQVALD